MKISMKRVEFLSVLQKADKLRVNVGSTLAEYHITVEGKKLTLRSMDASHSLTIEIPVESTEDCKFLFPVEKGISSLSKMDSEDIIIDVSNDLVTIVGGKARVKLPTSAISLYPFFEQKDLGEAFTIKAEILTKMIHMCSASVATPENTALHAIHIDNEKKDKGLCMVSTDGKRLTLTYGPVCDKDIPAEATIPIALVSRVHKLLSGDVIVGFSENGAQFKSNGINCIVNLTNAKYVNFYRVVPEAFSSKCVVNRGILMKAIDLAMVTIDKKHPAVNVTFDSNQMLISSVGGGEGVTDNAIECKYDGAKVEVAFNPTYMIDMLKVFPGDDVIVDFNNGCSPFAFHNDDNTYLYICMPLK